MDSAWASALKMLDRERLNSCASAWPEWNRPSDMRRRSGNRVLWVRAGTPGFYLSWRIGFTQKNPLLLGGGFSVLRGTDKESDDDLLSQARCLLSLARERFTVLFGMGRGGSTLLWSSDKGVRTKTNRFRWRLDPAFELSGVLSILRSSADCFIHADRSRRVWKKV